MLRPQTPLDKLACQVEQMGILLKSRAVLVQAIKMRLKPADINEAVLVGGSTRIPKVQQMVKELFEKEPHKGLI
jgi:molecular chaperone DnaK